MNPKLIFIYSVFLIYLISIGLTHINENFIFLVLIIMGFILGFMANESFFKESKLDSKLNNYKKYAVTEGDMLSNIRTTDSYREVPSGPPPSLSKNSEIERLKLTDKEIEAIKWCVEQWTGIKRAETLRNLLERIKDNENSNNN
jgi:hypothetical protein